MKLVALVSLAMAATAIGCAATAPGGSVASYALSASAGAGTVSASASAATTASASLASSPASAPTSAEPLPTDAPPTPNPTPDAQGCPVGLDDNLALSSSMDRTLVLSDGRTIVLMTAAIAARNGSWSADDAIPAFGTFDPSMLPATAKAGGTYTIAGSKGMRLTGGYAQAWHLSQISSIDGSPLTITGSSRALKVSSIHGRLVLQLPSTRDTWVVELTPQWQTACQKGDGAAYLVLTTN